MSEKKEYVERESLLKEAESRIMWNHQAAGVAVYEAIQEAPAADVVEVVRCEKCTYWEIVDVCKGRCNGIKNGLEREYTDEDDYCSYGERKEEEN